MQTCGLGHCHHPNPSSAITIEMGARALPVCWVRTHTAPIIASKLRGGCAATGPMYSLRRANG